MATTAQATGTRTATTTTKPPKLPGFLMGLGLGGFVDGILLHQILRWHHMLTDTGDNLLDRLLPELLVVRRDVRATAVVVVTRIAWS